MGKPKAHKEGKKPRERKFGPGEPQGKAKGRKDKAKVKEAGEGAEDGVVGEAAVREKEGVGPPDEPQDPPAPGRAALRKVQVWGEE